MGDTVSVVTFNIEFNRALDEAVRTLTRPEAAADIVLLQEMHREGVETVARALDMDYLYVPASVHARHGRQFGNAVLTRFRIEDPRKLILPHRGLGGLQRIAVLARITDGVHPVEAACVHLGTTITTGDRRDQAAAVLELLESRSGPGTPAIVGGDFNTADEIQVDAAVGPFRDAGFVHATADLRWTAHGLLGLLALDHVVARGFAPLGAERLDDGPDAGDHRPVRVVLRRMP